MQLVLGGPALKSIRAVAGGAHRKTQIACAPRAPQKAEPRVPRQGQEATRQKGKGEACQGTRGRRT
eukprot:2181395-Alexandrium_andersonii.AAC.1